MKTAVGVEMSGRATVGLDLSYTKTGVGVLINGAFDPGWSRTVSTKLEKTRPYDSVVRAQHIAHEIVKLLAQLEIQYGENLTVWIEGYAFGAYANREKLGELGGIVKADLLLNGYDYRILPVTSVRKAVCGKGNAKKDQVMKSLLKRWDIDIDDNDLADATALAKAGDMVTLDEIRALEREELYADTRQVLDELRKKSLKEEG